MTCNDLRRPLALAAFALLSSGVPAAPKVYVGNFKDNTVSVIDSDSKAVVATVPRRRRAPTAWASAAMAAGFSVTGDASSSMSVIDTASDPCRTHDRRRQVALMALP